MVYASPISQPRHRGLVSVRWRRAAECALLAVVAVAVTWPLAARLPHVLPMGAHRVPTVAMATEWALWWNAEQARAGFSSYWNAPIFSPTPGAFAFSEPQPLTGMLYGLYATGLAPETAYNLVLLSLLVLLGIATTRLCRAHGLGSIPALGAGGAALCLPLVHIELGTAPFVALAGPVLLIDAGARLCERPSRRTSAAVALALTASYLLCAQYTLFAVLILCAAAPFLIAPREWRRRLGATAQGALLLLPLALFAYRQASVLHRFELERTVSEVGKLSAHAAEYLQSSVSTAFPVPGFTTSERGLFPGLVKIALAVCALCLPIGERARRLRTLALVLCGAGFVLSLGPHLDLGPLSPHRLLSVVVPGFRQVRGLLRAAVFVQLGLLLLAAIGIEGGGRWVASSRRGAGKTVLATSLCVAAALLAVAEWWPAPAQLAPIAPDSRQRGWITWVREHTDADVPLAFLPVPRQSDIGAWRQTADWMRLQIRHGRPLVNGYASFFPASELALWANLTRFPERSALDGLRARGVKHCIVDRRAWTRAALGAVPELGWVYGDDEAQLDIYALR